MKLYNIYGRVINKNVFKYLIKWDAKSKSNLQRKTKQFLKDYWQNHVVYEEFPVFGSRMRVDFLNATKKIAVEVHGPQHSEFNKFFHNDSRLNYLKSIKRDVKKEEWLALNKYTFVEIYHDEVEDLSVEFFKDTYNIIL
jgi:very-short-patch-repair endonuclease